MPHASDSVISAGASANRISWKRWGNRSTCTIVLDTARVRLPNTDSVA